MSYRIAQIFTDKDIKDKLLELKKDTAILDFWETGTRREKSFYSVLCKTDNTQILTDKLTPLLEDDGDPNIVILPVQAVLPQSAERSEDNDDKTKDQKDKDKKRLTKSRLSREEIYEQVKGGSKLDQNYLLMVVLSTVVAAIGLLQNNPAVIIGAMVIAPLLGPCLALALGATLGDYEMLRRAAKTGLTGLGLAIVISLVVGVVTTKGLDAKELIDRTDVGFAGILLAAASGAAGVLSLTAGVSSALVGVMVAVALLPPAVTVGLMLGSGQVFHSLGALLLLSVNIVCVIISAKLIFWLKGIQPRTWYEKKRTAGAIRRQLVFWSIALAILAAIVAAKKLIA